MHANNYQIGPPKWSLIYINSWGIIGDRVVYFFLLQIVSEIVRVQPCSLMYCWLAALNIFVSCTIKMLQGPCLVKPDEKATLFIKLKHVMMWTNQLDQKWANYSRGPANTCRNFHIQYTLLIKSATVPDDFRIVKRVGLLTDGRFFPNILS